MTIEDVLQKIKGAKEWFSYYDRRSDKRCSENLHKLKRKLKRLLSIVNKTKKKARQQLNWKERDGRYVQTKLK